MDQAEVIVTAIDFSDGGAAKNRIHAFCVKNGYKAIYQTTSRAPYSSTLIRSCYIMFSLCSSANLLDLVHVLQCSRLENAIARAIRQSPPKLRAVANAWPSAMPPWLCAAN